MNQLQHCSLVAMGEGIQELPGLFLAGSCLGVGEAGLPRQRTGPHVAVAEEMSVEELPAERGEELGVKGAEGAGGGTVLNPHSYASSTFHRVSNKSSPCLSRCFFWGKQVFSCMHAALQVIGSAHS